MSFYCPFSLYLVYLQSMTKILTMMSLDDFNYNGIKLSVLNVTLKTIRNNSNSQFCLLILNILLFDLKKIVLF